MACRQLKFDVDHFSEDEALLIERPFDEVLRRAVAVSVFEAEECAAVESTRPTMPVFTGTPWQ